MTTSRVRSKECTVVDLIDLINELIELNLLVHLSREMVDCCGVKIDDKIAILIDTYLIRSEVVITEIQEVINRLGH